MNSRPQSPRVAARIWPYAVMLSWASTASGEALATATAHVTAAAAATAAADARASVRDCEHCPDLVAIAGGAFEMGSDPAEPRRFGLPEYWATREVPRHTVRVAPFLLARHEVTRREFAAFVAATGYAPEAGCWHFVGAEWLLDKARTWRDPGFEQADDHPVTCVNWHDAVAYADWLGATTGRRYRLPSEAEWEFAARAGTRTAFWFGDDAAAVCRHVNLGDRSTRERFGWDKTKIKYEVMSDWKGEPCDDGYATTAPVAAFPANPFGLYGMGGNANEWVADCWHDDYTAAPAEGAARTLSGDCGVRAMRGQGWTAIASSVRSAFRLKMNATDRRFTFGIRVARDP
jgi:formylglycine-generating enzyme required for sulfatase activity